MKIGIVYPKFGGVGGISRYIFSFLSNVTHDSVEVVLFSKTHDVVLPSHVRNIVVDIENDILWGYQVAKDLDKLVDFAVYHIPSVLYTVFLPSKPKILLTLHTTFYGLNGKLHGYQLYPRQLGWMQERLRFALEKRIIHKANVVLSLTEQGKTELSWYEKDKNIIVLPNGVDLLEFTPKNVKKDIDVLFFGRIEARKGSRSLINICKKLVKIKNDIRITIGGYGEDDALVCEKLAEEIRAGNIAYLGKVNFEEAIDLYNRAQIYASPSFYEGLPGTCLEALACGTPCVVWDLQFYSNLIVNGVNGYTVPCPNENEFAEVVIRKLSTEQTMMNRKDIIRKTVEQEYDWRGLSKKIVEVYLQSIKR